MQIRNRRKELGLTIEEAASRAGVGTKTWCRYEAGGSILASKYDGARLELMTRPGMADQEKPLNRTGYAHIAFSVGSKERVDSLTAELKDAGFEIASGPRTTGDGYYESCIVTVEGNQIEITE